MFNHNWIQNMAIKTNFKTDTVKKFNNLKWCNVIFNIPNIKKNLRKLVVVHELHRCIIQLQREWLVIGNLH